MTPRTIVLTRSNKLIARWRRDAASMIGYPVHNAAAYQRYITLKRCADELEAALRAARPVSKKKGKS